jgi:hypothetical protein
LFTAMSITLNDSPKWKKSVNLTKEPEKEEKE